MARYYFSSVLLAPQYFKQFIDQIRYFSFTVAALALDLFCQLLPIVDAPLISSPILFLRVLQLDFEAPLPQLLILFLLLLVVLVLVAQRLATQFLFTQLFAPHLLAIQWLVLVALPILPLLVLPLPVLPPPTLAHFECWKYEKFRYYLSYWELNEWLILRFVCFLPEQDTRTILFWSRLLLEPTFHSI